MIPKSDLGYGVHHRLNQAFGSHDRFWGQCWAIGVIVVFDTSEQGLFANGGWWSMPL
jgi:hypothetical protein